MFLKQIHATLNQCSCSIHDVGCPVVGKSCSLSSSVPEESNILGVETAHTYGECAGTDTNYFYSLVSRFFSQFYESFSQIISIFSFHRKAKILFFVVQSCVKRSMPMPPMWMVVMIQPLPGARIGLSSNLKCVLSLMAAASTMMIMPLVARKTALQVISNPLKVKTKLIDLHEHIQFSILVLTCPEKDVSCIPSCATDGASLDNVTTQLQCASKLRVV